MLKKALIIVIFAFLLCFILTGCEKSSNGAEQPLPEADSTAEKIEGNGYSVLPGSQTMEDTEEEEAAPDEQQEDGDIPEEDDPVHQSDPIDELILSMSDAQLAGQLVFCACPQGLFSSDMI